VPTQLLVAANSGVGVALCVIVSGAIPELVSVIV
jgi:hypothetical protein